VAVDSLNHGIGAFDVPPILDTLSARNVVVLVAGCLVFWQRHGLLVDIRCPGKIYDDASMIVRYQG